MGGHGFPGASSKASAGPGDRGPQVAPRARENALEEHPSTWGKKSSISDVGRVPPMPATSSQPSENVSLIHLPDKPLKGLTWGGGSFAFHSLGMNSQQSDQVCVDISFSLPGTGSFFSFIVVHIL